VPIRSAFYIDGFNFYHAIDELNDQSLKWCNLLALAQTIIPNVSESLIKVTFYSAFYPGTTKQRWRHEQYKQALENVGVKTVFGHFITEPMDCRACGHNWRKPTEKETDINLALGVVGDAHADIYDKAYILSADSDQVATARYVRTNFPHKQIATVAPPNRNFSVHITSLANGGRIALTKQNISNALFGGLVASTTGGRAVIRPREYDPPP
jgi:hypothetical protein